MEEVLNNLTIGDILYTTANETQYLFVTQNQDFGIVYSINHTNKILPIHTIQTALIDFNNGVNINAQWYRNFNEHEYNTRSCNLGVLRELLLRI